jgi:hypothetical protein
MITRNTIHERPLTDLVIRAIETMAKEQGIKTLKLTGRNKTQLYPADWMAGVEHEDKTENNIKDEENEENDVDYAIQAPDYDQDDELDDQQAYDTIDQNKIDDLLAEPGRTNEDVNPTDRAEQQEQVQQQQNEEDNAVTDDEDNETVTMESSRPSRERREPDELTFHQTKTNHLTFQGEQCQN